MNSDFIPGFVFGIVAALIAIGLPVACGKSDLNIEKQTITLMKPCTGIEVIKVNNKFWVCDGKEWRPTR